MIITHETVTRDLKVVRFDLEDLAKASDKEWVSVKPGNSQDQAIVGHSMRASDIREAIKNGPCGIRVVQRS